MKEIIYTTEAPQAIGPYSQAVKAGDTLYISGQLPIDPKTGVFADETIEGQTRQALMNVKSILEAAGYTLADVVKTTVLMKDMEEFAAMNGVYGEFFSGAYPARAAYEVARLPKDAKIEIEAIAVK